jgi:hypothetical protein
MLVSRQKQVVEEIILMIGVSHSLELPQPPLYDIEPDTSGYQLGAIIKQVSLPIAFFSRKLTSAQSNYSTTKKELLSGDETLKTYRSSILEGAMIWIHTDHKNLTYKNLCSKQVSKWCTMIKESCRDSIDKSGKEQVVTDLLSFTLSLRRQQLANLLMFYSLGQKL